MRIIINDEPFLYNVATICKELQIKYKEHIDNFENPAILTFKNGKKLDLGRKSLLRTGFKTLIAPFAVAILTDMYEQRGFVLEKHDRKTDLIDYLVEKVLYLIVLVESDIEMHVKSIPSFDDSEQVIESISPVVKPRDERHGPIRGYTKKKEE